MKPGSDFASIVKATHSAFDGNTPKELKFYYLDEDNEMVSITSQNDLEEALEIEELKVLKLTACASAEEARAELC